MTTPTVTELIRNGNPVEGRTEPARAARTASSQPAPSPSTDVRSVEGRRAGSHLQVAAPPAGRAPRLPLAA